MRKTIPRVGARQFKRISQIDVFGLEAVPGDLLRHRYVCRGSRIWPGRSLLGFTAMMRGTTPSTSLLDPEAVGGNSGVIASDVVMLWE